MYTSLLLFCNLTVAEQLTVSIAKKHPYKNLMGRTDYVKVFYTTNDKVFTCRVVVGLDNMKWTSVEKHITKQLFINNPLSNCLSKDSAKHILTQTFIQFGQGL